MDMTQSTKTEANQTELTKKGAWTLEDTGDGIWLLVFDLPGEKVNKLTSTVLEDLESILEDLERDKSIRALIIIGGKEASGTFIAGADIQEIRRITDAREATQKAQRGQTILGRIATLPAVTIAAIHGNCLGGGTELALACDMRVATQSEKTNIGLPEVQLGILPGFGGTQRLPRLVGLAQALPVILGGRALDGKKAAKIGLVDRLVYPPMLLEECRALAQEALCSGGKKYQPKRPKEGFFMRLMGKTPFGRMFIRSRAEKDIERRVGRHYPAPFKALEAVIDGYARSLADGLKLEADLVGELIASPTSKNLIQLFLASEEARRGSRSRTDGDEAESRDNRRAAPDCVTPSRRVAVLGAGVMGGGIAELLARKDYRVRLKDIQSEALGTGIAKVHELLKARVKRRRMTPRDMQNRLSSITTTLDYSGFDQVGTVIEAVVENMDVKKAVLKEVEPRLRDDALFASNTSALSITEMQSVAERPERVVGLHFFNPVDRMLLVEIIAGKQSSEEALREAEDLARSLGKIPVRVADGPGFLVNRLLAPYLNEATRLFGEGFEPARVDAAVRDFGMPMGPFELLDEIGLDVAAKVAVFLHGALGARLEPPTVMDQLLKAGILGKKSNKGFYVHNGKKKAPNPAALRHGGTGGSDFKPDERASWIRRLMLPIVNEAALALGEKVVARPSVVDLAMVMGTGFAPFRGGPLRYADSLGLPAVVDTIQKHGIAGGEPAELLVELANSGSTFYAMETTATLTSDGGSDGAEAR